MQQRFRGEKKRKKKIFVRVNDDEYERIIKEADKSRLDVASFLRHIALKYSHNTDLAKKKISPSIEPDRSDPAKVLSLKKIKLFNALSEEELMTISDKIHIRRCKKNEIVLLPEDTNKSMYLVLEGAVKVSKTTEEGKEIILAFREQGEYFGEMSLIDGEATSAMVTASADSVIAVITRDNFFSLLYSNKKILLNLLLTLCSRIRGSSKTIEMLTNLKAAQRLKLLFDAFSQQHGKETDKGTVLNIKITHQDIADMTGLARQTVTKILDEWKADKSMTVLENRKYLFSRSFFDK